jgi:flagellar motor switch protein FliN/FliY
MVSEKDLTQEEIDALFRGETSFTLTEIETDALGEIANISMGTAATTLSSLLAKKVEITTPQISITTQSKLRSDHPLPYVIVNVQYTDGLVGENMLILKIRDACLIVDLMMGGDTSEAPEKLNEIHLSAIGEAMNQMMGSGSTSMSSVFQKKISISPPSVRVINLAEENIQQIDKDEQIVKIIFHMTIEGIIDSEIMQIIPLKFAKQTAEFLVGSIGESDYEQQDIQAAEQSVNTKTNDAQKTAKPGIAVQQVQFAPLTEITTSDEISNISLIMDVPLQFTVELGRTQRTIKDILELGPGAIVELDKMAGEAVDIYINGKSIAKGEVVVIDENYGVRITEILSSAERISNLK